MPTPQYNWDYSRENELIAEQLDYNADDERAQAESNISRLNGDQKSAFQQIMDSIENSRGTTFFVNGPGGCGKTFLYNTIAHQVRSQHGIILCVASSGIAALLLPGGRTAHSVFKIPIDGLTDDSVCSIPKE
ncbi:hypothetical protein BDN72DRAFT_777004, partial [Pluteus cervinus]